jgi:hypothetical protein
MNVIEVDRRNYSVIDSFFLRTKQNRLPQGHVMRLHSLIGVMRSEHPGQLISVVRAKNKSLHLDVTGLELQVAIRTWYSTNIQMHATWRFGSTGLFVTFPSRFFADLLVSKFTSPHRLASHQFFTFALFSFSPSSERTNF